MAERLYRSRTDRMIGGVAGGLAELYDLDPSLVRVGWVLVAIVSGGLAAIVYLVMLIVVPEAPPGWRPARREPGTFSAWSPAGAADPAAAGQDVAGASAAAAGGSAESSEAGASLETAALADAERAGVAGGGPTGGTSSGGWGSAGSAWTATGASTSASDPDAARRRTDAGIVFGGILIVIGAWFLLDRYLDIDGAFVWPVIAIAGGVLLIARSMRPSG